VVGAVIVLVVVAGLVSAVSLAVARHGTRPPPEEAPPGPASDEGPVAAPRAPRTPAPRRPDPGRSPAAARPRKPKPRPSGRKDPNAAGRRRGRGPLTALSAVEKRGSLARLDTVTFVEAPPATPAATPALADAPAVPAARSDQAVVTPEPALAFDAHARPTRRLQAPCQIVRVEQVGPGTVIDLITLRACDVAGEAVPSGTPLALGFGPVPPGAACQDLAAVMGYWEAIGAVVDLEVVESALATRYRFDCRDDGLALLVQSERA
jgi:hypothetical protein